jgi:hypothetical protein
MQGSLGFRIRGSRSVTNSVRNSTIDFDGNNKHRYDTVHGQCLYRAKFPQWIRVLVYGVSISLSRAWARDVTKSIGGKPSPCAVHPEVKHTMIVLTISNTNVNSIKLNFVTKKIFL